MQVSNIRVPSEVGSTPWTLNVRHALVDRLEQAFFVLRWRVPKACLARKKIKFGKLTELFCRFKVLIAVICMFVKCVSLFERWNLTAIYLPQAAERSVCIVSQSYFASTVAL